MELRARIRLEQIGIARFAAMGQETTKALRGEGRPKRAVLRFSFVPWWMDRVQPGPDACWLHGTLEVIAGPDVRSPEGEALFRALEIGEYWELVLRPMGTGDEEYERAKRQGVPS